MSSWLAGEQVVEVGGSAVDVLVGTERILDAERGRGRGHELHQAASSNARDGIRVTSGLSVDQRGEEVGVDVMCCSCLGEQAANARVGSGGSLWRTWKDCRREIGKRLDQTDRGCLQLEIARRPGHGGVCRGDRVEADFSGIGQKFAADAVQFKAIFQSDVLGCAYQRAED